MKIFCFIFWLTYSNILLQLANAMEKFNALVIQKTKTELQFAKVVTLYTDYFGEYKSTHNNLWYLCPDEYQDALNVKFSIESEYSQPGKICLNPVLPTIFKVSGEITNDQGETRIHLYQIGFTITGAEFNNIANPTEYDSINKDYHFMPMISVYFDKELQITIAVNYEIIQADDKQRVENKVGTYFSSISSSEKNQQFFRDRKSKLREILGNIYDEDENKYNLSLGSLVSENDFKDGRWKKTACNKLHQILIWRKNLPIWKSVREFLRLVANVDDSHTTITAGIGKVLTITHSEGHEFTLKWGQGDATVFIPELYWIAIKFTINNETTGMFIIMHNEPDGENTNVKKICDTNLCKENYIWYPTPASNIFKGRVYCCPMDATTIKSLGVAFLLNEQKFFDGMKYVQLPTIRSRL